MNALIIAAVAANLWTGFANPPMANRPWCYHWWVNGNVDKATLTADLEDMKALGFGGINMIDSRGYWDNDREHVKTPPVDIQWGTEKWYDMVEHEIRECARLGLEFTMNAACSGGTLSRQIDGKIVETDVTKKDEVRKHLDAAIGPLLKRCPELIGKTFTHLYSVSYEGNKAGGSWKRVKDTFYAAMTEWAHEHGLKVYSESGGPWEWGGKSTKLDCSQIDILAVNDFPQGEYWPLSSYTGGGAGVRHANANGRFFMRGIVVAARREHRRIASAEAFTHMLHHYSVDPSVLKPLGDIAFADGINRLVWHTYTCSPARFGVPGAEYFAGSHINRHVTWHDDASAFISYLGRCQYLLQSGEPVDDGEFKDEALQYYGWGRFRKDEKAQFTTTHRKIGDIDVFFVAGEGKGELKVNADLDGKAVEIWDAVAVTRSAAKVKDGKVQLDLPIGGSCFIVVGEDQGVRGVGAPVTLATLPRVVRSAVSVAGPWKVAFAYRPGIAAAPPASMTMDSLVEWTSLDSLKDFGGTASYKTTFKFDGGEGAFLSVGELPSGTARVIVNGIDCGVAWCYPFEVDVSKAIKSGENQLEIRYSNNWHNRLTADAALPESARVTTSMFWYSDKPRTGNKKNMWSLRPSIYSGPAVGDELQRSGLLGPVQVFNRSCARVSRFADSIAYDTALSWVNSPGHFICPAAYSNNTYRYAAELVKSTGVKHVRERLRWTEVAPDAKTWKPGKYLDNAKMLDELGLGISGMFHDAPEYLRGKKDKLPRDPIALYDFCRKLAETFGDRMEIWEFWNEEDIGFATESAWDFAAMYKAAALGFRAGGFKGWLTSGALCRGVRNPYAVAYFANDVMAYSDFFNFHTYSSPSAYQKLFAELRHALAENGSEGMAILLTECGGNQEGDSNHPGVMKQYMAHSKEQEAIQEEFVVKSQILTRMEGIVRNYFFVFGAYNERKGAKDWGLIRRDGTCKPAVDAIRRLVAEVGEGTLAGEVAVPGGKVRAFRFDMPDGSRRLVYWRRSELDDKRDEIKKWNDDSVECAIPLVGGGTLPLVAHRRAAYVRLEKGADVAIARAPLPFGKIGVADDPGFDPSIVLRLDADAEQSVLGDRKGVLEITGDTLRHKLTVWNLDSKAKSGKLSFTGVGAVDGLPESVTVPARGSVTLDLVYRVTSDGINTRIAYGGTFEGRRISRLVAPVYSDLTYRRSCNEQTLDWKNLKRWKRNGSSNRFDFGWDDKEGAVRFNYAWDLDAPGMRDRWFFSRYMPDLKNECFTNVMMITYEVKSRQDKVENDYNSARIFLRERKSGGNLNAYLMPPPTADWETRRLIFTDSMRTNGVSELQFGGHPRGRDVTYFIRNIKIYHKK